VLGLLDPVLRCC